MSKGPNVGEPEDHAASGDRAGAGQARSATRRGPRRPSSPPPALIFADIVLIVFFAVFLSLFVYWMAGNGLAPARLPDYFSGSASSVFAWLTGISGVSAAVLALLFRRPLTIWHPLGILVLALLLIAAPFSLGRAAPSEEKWSVKEHIGVGNWVGEWSARFDGALFHCGITAPNSGSAQCVAASAGNRRFVYRIVPGTDEIACLFTGTVEGANLIGEYFCRDFNTRLRWSAVILPR
jgi:hypothetical protein